MNPTKIVRKGWISYKRTVDLLDRDRNDIPCAVARPLLERCSRVEAQGTDLDNRIERSFIQDPISKLTLLPECYNFRIESKKLETTAIRSSAAGVRDRLQMETDRRAEFEAANAQAARILSPSLSDSDEDQYSNSLSDTEPSRAAPPLGDAFSLDILPPSSPNPPYADSNSSSTTSLLHPGSTSMNPFIYPPHPTSSGPSATNDGTSGTL